MSDMPFSIEIPKVDSVNQGNEEHFFLEFEGDRKRLQFHDYGEIFSVPELYEHLFYETLKCQSPEVVCTLLEQEIEQSVADFSELSVLDVGAGNGMVGEQLVDRGADCVVGIDIIKEAAEATFRDRPGVYEDYYVADITDLPEPIETELEDRDFNCMTVVAALGFGDMPPHAFAEGYNMISRPGWIAFNIKDEFICEKDSTGFCKLINRMMDGGIMRIKNRRRYRHRFCQDGTPLYYNALVGEKINNIPDGMLADL